MLAFDPTTALVGLGQQSYKIEFIKNEDVIKPRNVQKH